VVVDGHPGQGGQLLASRPGRAAALNPAGQVTAIAVLGALISHRASFLPGVRASLLIAVVVLAAASMAAFTLPGPRRENELTGLGG
jgi:hypothetical protein